MKTKSNMRNLKPEFRNLSKKSLKTRKKEKIRNFLNAKKITLKTRAKQQEKKVKEKINKKNK
jgi:hypothetical protein